MTFNSKLLSDIDLSQCGSWEATIETFNDYLSLSLSPSFDDTEEGLVFYIDGTFVSASISLPSGEFSFILKKSINKWLEKEIFDDIPYREIWATQTLITQVLDEIADMSGEGLSIHNLPDIGRA
jgi:hypothetical protein